MIYTNNEEYKVRFFKDIQSGRSPVLEYFRKLSDKEELKILKYIEFLRINKGHLNEPYSKHIKGKIRELRIDFGNNKNRIFYFIFIKKTIIFLHTFLKKTAKTPISELKKAEKNYQNTLKNPKTYE